MIKRNQQGKKQAKIKAKCHTPVLGSIDAGISKDEPNPQTSVPPLKIIHSTSGTEVIPRKG